MAEVHVLPGVERRDLGAPLGVESVMKAVAEADLVDLVVVGRTRLGEQYIASSMPDADKAVGMLVRAQHFIVEANVEQAPFDTEKPPG